MLAASVEQQTGRERNEAFRVVVITVHGQVVIVVDVVEVVATADSRLIVDIGGGTRNVVRADVEVRVILIFLVDGMHVVVVERHILIVRLYHQRSLFALAFSDGLVVTVTRNLHVNDIGGFFFGFMFFPLLFRFPFFVRRTTEAQQ